MTDGLDKSGLMGSTFWAERGVAKLKTNREIVIIRHFMVIPLCYLVKPFEYPSEWTSSGRALW
jgi:hypothetical protein